MDHDGIDPDIRAFIATMRADWARHPPLDSLPLAEARAIAEQVRERWRRGGPAMAATRELTVTTPAGPLPLRVHYPVADRPLPALIYVHGGGFTLFSIDTHDRLMREYAAAAGCIVIGVDYPLAPEFRYPVALDRIVGLMDWLAEEGAALGIDSHRLAFGGDSAGANLSVATCLRLRDADKLKPVRALLLNYGAFVDGCSDESEAQYGGPGSIMDRAELGYYWRNYLRGAEDAADPFACPLLADLTGLPPSILIVPERDIIAEQSFAMAERLAEAGVEVDSRLYAGATHSFLEAMSISGLARQAIADGAAFVRRHFELA